jgi:hypothetical protein
MRASPVLIALLPLLAGGSAAYLAFLQAAAASALRNLAYKNIHNQIVELTSRTAGGSHRAARRAAHSQLGAGGGCGRAQSLRDQNNNDNQELVHSE